MQEIEYLGKEVQVKMDRPMGSKHPKFGFVYQLNYGFIPNTIGGDGKEIDAYIIGADQPLESFEGIVKAVIIRHNDKENKLIVTKSDYELDKDEIEKLTHFQEKYFDISISLLGK